MRLPMKPGRTGTKRLQTARYDHVVCGVECPRHRHRLVSGAPSSYFKFLNVLDAQTPPDVAIHAIVDNYATHKHPRFSDGSAAIRGSIFTPTSAS